LRIKKASRLQGIMKKSMNFLGSMSNNSRNWGLLLWEYQNPMGDWNSEILVDKELGRGSAGISSAIYNVYWVFCEIC
jgi:hypothetical protein